MAIDRSPYDFGIQRGVFFREQIAPRPIRFAARASASRFKNLPWEIRISSLSAADQSPYEALQRFSVSAVVGPSCIGVGHVGGGWKERTSNAVLAPMNDSEIDGNPASGLSLFCVGPLQAHGKDAAFGPPIWSEQVKPTKTDIGDFVRLRVIRRPVICNQRRFCQPPAAAPWIRRLKPPFKLRFKVKLRPVQVFARQSGRFLDESA